MANSLNTSYILSTCIAADPSAGQSQTTYTLDVVSGVGQQRWILIFNRQSSSCSLNFCIHPPMTVKREDTLDSGGELVSDTASTSSVGEEGSDYDSSSSSSDITNGDSDNESSAGSDVDLSFTGYNMDRRDYHAVQQFLLQIFGRGLENVRGGNSGAVECTQLTKAIVDGLSEYVGTTAKADETEDPLAFVTLIPLELPAVVRLEDEGDREQVRGCLASLRKMLAETARRSGLKKEQILLIERALLQAPGRTALVLAERFMNLPVDLAAPLYRQLLDDLPAAAEEDAAFAPDTILLIAPIYRELPSILDAEAISTAPEARRKRPRKSPADEEEPADAGEPPKSITDFSYYYAEDELLPEITTLHWDFRIKTPHETADSRRAFGDRGVDPARRVFVLTMEQLRTFVQQCQALI